MHKHCSYILLLFILALAGCSKSNQQKTAESFVSAAFSADSAYRFIEEQVAFGARVPGSEAHYNCYLYLKQQLERLGAIVEIQQGELLNYAGEPQPIVNIIGHICPDEDKRILLCAHWDCRPWSDQEPDYDNRMQPVLGANDGASGVGVLLEIARQLQDLRKSSVRLPGVDIVFFDVEDMGTPEFYTGKQREDTWCLGSQLWAERYKHQSDYTFTYGILLDMVGSPDATFCKEYFSTQYAPRYVDKLWKTSGLLGYSRFFRSESTYPLTDDHYYVNRIANIPCLDIIDYNIQTGTGFPEYWHTNHDNMQNISTATLDAVGRTVLTTILN